MGVITGPHQCEGQEQKGSGWSKLQHFPSLGVKTALRLPCWHIHFPLGRSVSPRLVQFFSPAPRLSCAIHQETQMPEGWKRPLAIVSSSPHFSVKSEVKAVTWCCSCLHHGRLLQWVDDHYIKSSISSLSPVWEKDISRPPVIPRQNEATLLHWI